MDKSINKSEITISIKDNNYDQTFGTRYDPGRVQAETRPGRDASRPGTRLGILSASLAPRAP